MNNSSISHKSIVADINKYASQHMRLKLTVYEYNGKELILVATEEGSSRIQLEIVFEDLLYMSAHFSWYTNPREGIIVMPNDVETIKLNEQFKIKTGYQLFGLISERHDSMFYVAAKSIDYDASHQ